MKLSKVSLTIIKILNPMRNGENLIRVFVLKNIFLRKKIEIFMSKKSYKNLIFPDTHKKFTENFINFLKTIPFFKTLCYNSIIDKAISESEHNVTVLKLQLTP